MLYIITILFIFQFSEGTDSDLRKELSKREVLISQLLTQSKYYFFTVGSDLYLFQYFVVDIFSKIVAKELLAEKERQEIELQAQRATLQEQRNHIDILDNALTNAQANVVRLEDEVSQIFSEHWLLYLINI